MLLGGRITDLLGAKRVVLAGLVLFTAASLATGLAGSPGVPVAGRVAQGLGAALLSPSALSLVVALFDGEERNRALGGWSALGGGGAALGVLLGGVLTPSLGWPWVFFVNVPIGVAIVVALAVMLPDRSVPAARSGLDLFGAALVTASTGSLICALIAAGERGWLSAVTGGFVAAALAGYLLFVLWQRRAASPLMDVRLLARRPVATGAFLIWMATALMVAVFFLGTFSFQHARGYGAMRTGLLFLPVALATMAGANLTGRVLGRLGARVPAVAGLLVSAAGMAVPALSQSPAAAVVSSVAAASLVGTTLDGFTRGFTVAAAASSRPGGPAPDRPRHQRVRPRSTRLRGGRAGCGVRGR